MKSSWLQSRIWAQVKYIMQIIICLTENSNVKEIIYTTKFERIYKFDIVLKCKLFRVYSWVIIQHSVRGILLVQRVSPSRIRHLNVMLWKMQIKRLICRWRCSRDLHEWFRQNIQKNDQEQKGKCCGWTQEHKERLFSLSESTKFKRVEKPLNKDCKNVSSVCKLIFWYVWSQQCKTSLTLVDLATDFPEYITYKG